jgi:hypothetical protein
MNPSHQRIEALRRLMHLEERRAVLQAEVDQLNMEIEAVQSQLFLSPSTTRSRRSLANIPTSKLKAFATRRMGRGELRSQILDALRAAGDKGVQVRDLAVLLRIKPVNIHSWFHSALRRFPQHIQKTGPGRYQLSGTPDFPEPARPVRTPGSERRGFSSKRARSRRGEIARQILSILTAAGREGVSVQEIAAKIGTNYRNIHVWFSSTGKKNPQILKIGRGKFSLMPSAA